VQARRRFGPHSLVFRYYNRNRIGCREGILEGIVEHLFLVPPRALGEVDVVVTSFVFWIGIHFNFPDPAVDVPIVDPSAGPERRHNSPSATVRRYGVPAAADWGTASRRLLLTVSKISRRRPPVAGLQTRRQSLAQRAAEEPWPADPHQGASAAGSGRPEIRAHRDGPLPFLC
jgi:hypothetical protein